MNKAYGLLLFALLWGCSEQTADVSESCSTGPEFSTYCGFQNPEDLALTPDGRYLIVSEFGGMSPLSEMTPGVLSLFDLEREVKRPLPIAIKDKAWGRPSCDRSESQVLNPHGIDIVQRDDGLWQLAVVSHLPHESVEFFELSEAEPWRLYWRGCVESAPYYFNDVALTSAGEVYATHMFDRDTSMASVLWYVLSGANSGQVVHWQPAVGFTELPFTAGSFPNGIAYHAPTQRLVVNYNTGDKTVLFDLRSEKALASYEHNSPDNVVIRDGAVWVANHDHAALKTLACSGQANCPLPFSINKLSIDNLSLLTSFPFNSDEFGVGTVGLAVGNSLWIGSYHADRLGRAALK